MKKYSFTLSGLIFVVTISVWLSNCSKDNTAYQIEYVHSRMAEIENAVLLKQFNTTPASMKINNILYFSKIDKLRSTNGEIERNEIQAALYSYNLSTSTFCDQKMEYNFDLSNEERILYESFVNAFINSEGNFVAICEFYINEVACLKIDNQAKSDFIERIGLLRDLLIYVDYEKFKNTLTYDVIFKSSLRYEDCYDDCMVSELEAIQSRTMKMILFIVHLPFSAAELLVVCAVDCIS
jgi:hypothetical protein